MIIFRCKKCNHIFSVEKNEDKYCTACDCKDLELLNKDNFDKLQKFKNEERIKSQENKEEYKVLNNVQSFLEEFKLNVWRECIPDQCLTWKYPYSVDMIFEIPTYGLIGIEGKNINTHEQGSKYAEAYLQIRDKYSNKTYFNGKKVRRWCVYANINSTYYDGNRVDCFVKHFFNKLGISYLQFGSGDWGKRIIIDGYTKQKIEISKQKEWNSNIMIDKIEGIDKNNFLDYGGNIK